MAYLSIPLRRRTPWWRAAGRELVTDVRTVGWLARRIVRHARPR
jgi:hypothetical protein